MNQPDAERGHREHENRGGENLLLGADGAQRPELGALKVADTVRGQMTYFAFDGVIGRALEIYGEWAENEAIFLRQFVQPGDTIIDAGANIGTHTAAFSEFVQPGGKVISIEASPEISFVLDRNIKANHLENVTRIQAAAGKERGQVFFPQLDPGVYSNVGGAKSSADTGLRTEVIPLDSLACENVALLKADVEGAELDVLLGASSLIERCKPVVVCEMLDIDAGLSLVQHMTQRQYRTYFAAFAAFNRRNYRGVTENTFGHAHEASLVFVPPTRSIPRQTDGMYIHAFSTVSDFAKWFFEMPRYGDMNTYDREAERLIQERAEREREAKKLKERIARLEESLSKAADDSDLYKRQIASMMEKIGRLERCVSTLRKVSESRRSQLALAQEMIGAKQALLNSVRSQLDT